MNDRLGDLGGSLPAWAVEDTTTDVESGFIDQSPPPTATPAHNTSSWTNDDVQDDFDFAPPPTAPETSIQESVEQNYMDNFFKDVDKVKANIKEVERVTRRIADINEEALLTTSETKERELGAEVKPMIGKTNKMAKGAKDLLKVLKSETEKYKAEETLKTSDIRVRENLCNTLTRKFIDEMKLYQASQQKYKVDIKKKAERQILTMKEDATPEEIEQIMQTGGGREELFQQTILAGGVNDQIKQAYSKVATKYQDVLTLEQSVAELHQMFLDFALLTEQQGELIDQIEHNVKSAADHVDDANVLVYDAIEISKKVRKKQCCIIVIVIILTFIILFSLRILP